MSSAVADDILSLRTFSGVPSTVRWVLLLMRPPCSSRRPAMQTSMATFEWMKLAPPMIFRREALEWMAEMD
eukprot:CAMPEP_0170580110 /NCGR_PEP_ID=MMETSP0224-20130122/6338_1 /TAXON_ID=285029 /ORGANISM="Togula jolla, Strain CCCM 725" /LENGTH=70 /DNA_ID=CAMNT_0010903171 /DNA_START=573 /DNA_END=782 /DNA_ORIENTATION=+